MDGRRELSKHERDALLRKYLPTKPIEPPARRTPKKPTRPKPLRDFLRSQAYILVYAIIHALLSIYLRIRRAYHAIFGRIWAILYYHHRTPELIRKDVRALSRLPEHLSVILDFDADDQGGAGLEGLVNDVSEVAAWCASAGIPMLSVYEKTGIHPFHSPLRPQKPNHTLIPPCAAIGMLKSYLPQTHRAITQTLHAYFGAHNRPTLSLRAPHLPSFSPPSTPPSSPYPSPASASATHLTVLLLSADDGRATLVDLTKTLAEMSQRGKLAPSDISAELIDAEISESVVGEPDLLLLFGPRVVLEGYPPWQVRLTEIL